MVFDSLRLCLAICFLPLVFVLFWVCNSEMFLFFLGLISSIFLKIKWCQVNDEPGREAESPLERVVIVCLLLNTAELVVN